LLNLASIYTTGFECPDIGKVIPELQQMVKATAKIISYFKKSFLGLNSFSDSMLVLQET